MESRPFVITGCGNSGLLFTARLLSSLGVRTSFEEFFTPYTSIADLPYHYYINWLGITATCGESSSLAAPYGYAFTMDPDVHVIVMHQVRNPIHVIRSLLRRETFEPKFHLLPNVRFVFRHLPELDQDDPPIVLAMKYWLHWNLIVDKWAPYLTYRVEAIEEALPGIFAAIKATLPDPGLAEYRTTYHAGRRDESITLASLPDGELKGQLVEQALRYGYTMQDLAFNHY